MQSDPPGRQDPQRQCLGAEEAVSPHVAHGDLRSRDASLGPAPRRCQRRRELHAGTRSLRRAAPAPPPRCSMLPPRWSPSALAAGQTPAPEGAKELEIQLASLGQTTALACSACRKVWTTRRYPWRGGTVRARRERTQCSLQSTSMNSSSCQGKPLPSCSGRTSLLSVLG